MGRPHKRNLDYFAMICGFFRKEKVIALRREHGALGLTTFIFLLTTLFDAGYYLTFSNLNDLAITVAENIGSKKEPTAKVAAHVLEVIRYCAELGLIDKQLFAMNCITSVEIQEYYAMTKERYGGRALIKEFSLLSDDNAFELVSEENNAVYATKTIVSVTENAVMATETPQSKVKERKLITSVCTEKLRAFCEKWGVEQDTKGTHGIDFDRIDFDRLDTAYAESKKFLQTQSVAKCLSWIVKNYASIAAGKYKDFAEPKPNNGFVTDESADALNRVFEKLNEDI